MAKASLSVGSEVIARHDFQSDSKGHLAIFKGDVLTVVGNENQDEDWCEVQNSSGSAGLVPKNHLQKRVEVRLNSMPWFHGKITRDEAEILLQPPKVIL